jgi:lysophospholipase L1-like esterase
VSALAAERLRAEGRRVELDLRACDGGTIADITTKQLPGAVPADAIVVSFGGNDLGFRRLLTECLASRCRSYDQPADRFAGFAHEPGRTDWEVLTQRLVDGFARLRGGLAPGGAVYALTYPLPFPAVPDAACIGQLASLTPESRDLANAAIDRLDDAIIAAAAQANELAGAVYVQVVEWRSAPDAPRRTVTDAAGVTRTIRDNPNGICSPDPVLNGLVTTELSDSFHPTERGHRFAAAAIARALAEVPGSG